MRILNLYSGIGGNRKLWKGDVTAVESVPHVAEVYKSFYPEDTVVVGDAHQYLLDHYKEFDFIWSSPPCPTHSQLNIPLHAQGYVRYPSMDLYQEIIFLKQWGGREGRKWCVENVLPYYTPLVEPTIEIERHLFWTNFRVSPLSLEPIGAIYKDHWQKLEVKLNMYLPRELLKGVDRYQKRTMLRDITRPEIGEHLLNSAKNIL